MRAKKEPNMTPRSIRRAAERRAKKLALKADRTMMNQPEPFEPSQSSTQSPERSEGSISPAQLAANRANAQLSTGPKTTVGKGKSCLNAVKTGLTGRTVLLPGDDAVQYEQHVCSYFNRLKPQDDRERELVQSLADTQWRILRIPSLESGIYALGRLECKDMFQEEDPAVRAVLIDAHVYRTCQKQINNLYLQESRLHRLFERHMKELIQLKSLRAARDKAGSAQPAIERIPAIPAANGFEFATARSGRSPDVHVMSEAA
jgi:hypothetical protein